MDLTWKISMPGSKHLNEDEIEKYSMGLSGEAEALWDEHLLACAECQAQVEQADAYVKAMRLAAAQLRKIAAPRRSRNHALMPVLTAIAAVTVVGLVWVSQRGFADGRTDKPAVISLQATRGTSSGVKAPSRRPLELQLDITGLVPTATYKVQIVANSGKEVWKGTGTAEGVIVRAAVPPQEHGAYFVRVYSPSGELLREYALEVRGTD